MNNNNNKLKIERNTNVVLGSTKPISIMGYLNAFFVPLVLFWGNALDLYKILKKKDKTWKDIFNAMGLTVSFFASGLISPDKNRNILTLFQRTLDCLFGSDDNGLYDQDTRVDMNELRKESLKSKDKLNNEIIKIKNIPDSVEEFDLDSDKIYKYTGNYMDRFNNTCPSRFSPYLS